MRAIRTQSLRKPETISHAFAHRLYSVVSIAITRIHKHTSPANRGKEITFSNSLPFPSQETCRISRLRILRNSLRRGWINVAIIWISSWSFRRLSLWRQYKLRVGFNSHMCIPICWTYIALWSYTCSPYTTHTDTHTDTHTNAHTHTLTHTHWHTLTHTDTHTHTPLPKWPSDHSQDLSKSTDAMNLLSCHTI
jgi:hypothetical protein